MKADKLFISQVSPAGSAMTSGETGHIDGVNSFAIGFVPSIECRLFNRRGWRRLFHQQMYEAVREISTGSVCECWRRGKNCFL